MNALVERGVLEPSRTARLTLRPVEPLDAAETAAIMSEPVSRNLTSWSGNLSWEAAEERIADAAARLARGRGMELAIVRQADDRLLGWIGFHVTDPEARTARLGFWLGAPFHGQGYISEALPAAIRAACDHLRVEYLEACVLPHNDVSFRVLRKLGFRDAGHEEIYSPVRERTETYICLALPVGVSRELP
jgi:ribosomal-protein-alanine N-acetyltransferase